MPIPVGFMVGGAQISIGITPLIHPTMFALMRSAWSILKKVYCNHYLKLSRIKLMQTMYDGPKSSAQLSEATSLRGGNLYYHLKSLLHASYVKEVAVLDYPYIFWFYCLPFESVDLFF